MRDIKFRAWLPIEGKMSRPHTLKDIVDICSFGYPDSAIWQQYIGLKDRNGVEIYEGDIVMFAVKKRFCKNDKCENGNSLGIDSFCPNCGTKTTYDDMVTKAKIVFTKGGFALWYNETEEYYQEWQVFIAEIYIEWIEIIGNIYQNPELLTTGSEVCND